MAQAPNYTPEQVQAALDQGLISAEDAAYLNKALEDSFPWGGTAGALGGAAAGAAMGAGGAKLAGDMLGDSAKAAKLAPNAPEGAGAKREGVANWLNTANPDVGIPFTDMAIQSNKGDVLGGGLGGVAGGVAGGMAGDAMFPNEGMGVEGKGYMDPRSGAVNMDPDMALRLLIDPNTPPQVKKQIIGALQNSPDYQEMQGGEMEDDGDLDDMGMGGVAGLGLGALAGAGLGAVGGHMGANALKGMAPGAEGMMGTAKNWSRDAGAAMAGAPEFMGANPMMNYGGMAGAGLGGVAGGVAGAMGGNALEKRYADPLAGA